MRSPTLPVDFTGDSKADRKPRIARLRRDWRAHRLVSAVSRRESKKRSPHREKVFFNPKHRGWIFMTARLSLVTENSAPGSISPNPRARMDSNAKSARSIIRKPGLKTVPDPSRDVSHRALETEPRTVAVAVRRSNVASNATAKRRSAAIFPKGRPRTFYGGKTNSFAGAARAERHTTRAEHTRERPGEKRERALTGTEKRERAPSQRARLERRRYAPRPEIRRLRAAIIRALPPFPARGAGGRGGRARSARRPASPSSRASPPSRWPRRASEAGSRAAFRPRASAEARHAVPFAPIDLTTSK